MPPLGHTGSLPKDAAHTPAKQPFHCWCQKPNFVKFPRFQNRHRCKSLPPHFCTLGGGNPKEINVKPTLDCKRLPHTQGDRQTELPSGARHPWRGGSASRANAGILREEGRGPGRVPLEGRKGPQRTGTQVFLTEHGHEFSRHIRSCRASQHGMPRSLELSPTGVQSRQGSGAGAAWGS